MTKSAALNRLTGSKVKKEKAIKLYKDLNKALKDEDKSLYRKVKNTLCKLLDSKEYYIVIPDICSPHHQTDVWSKKTKKCKFSFKG